MSNNNSGGNSIMKPDDEKALIEKMLNYNEYLTETVGKKYLMYTSENCVKCIMKHNKDYDTRDVLIDLKVMGYIDDKVYDDLYNIYLNLKIERGFNEQK